MRGPSEDLSLCRPTNLSLALDVNPEQPSTCLEQCLVHLHYPNAHFQFKTRGANLCPSRYCWTVAPGLWYSAAARFRWEPFSGRNGEWGVTAPPMPRVDGKPCCCSYHSLNAPLLLLPDCVWFGPAFSSCWFMVYYEHQSFQKDRLFSGFLQLQLCG